MLKQNKMKKMHKNVYCGNVGKSRVWAMLLQKYKKSAKKVMKKCWLMKYIVVE